MVRLPDIPFDLFWEDQARKFNEQSSRLDESWAFRVNAEDEQLQVPDEWSYSPREKDQDMLAFHEIGQQDAENDYSRLRQQEVASSQMATLANPSPSLEQTPTGLLPDFDSMLASRGMSELWPQADPMQPQPGFAPDPAVQENSFEPMPGFAPLGDLEAPSLIPHPPGASAPHQTQQHEDRRRRAASFEGQQERTAQCYADQAESDRLRALDERYRGYDDQAPFVAPNRETSEERYLRETAGKPWNENIGPGVSRRWDQIQAPILGGLGEAADAQTEQLAQRYPKVYGTTASRHNGKFWLDPTLTRILEPLNENERLNKIAELKSQGIIPADYEVPVEFDRAPGYRPWNGQDRPDKLTPLGEDTRDERSLGELIEYSEKRVPEGTRDLTQGAAGIATTLGSVGLGVGATRSAPGIGRAVLRAVQAAVDPIEGGLQATGAAARLGAAGIEAARNLRADEVPSILSDYGRAAMGQAPSPGQIVSPEVAREMTHIPVRKDYPARFVNDVLNDPQSGVRYTPEGLALDLERWQKPTQPGQEAARGGVFYRRKDANLTDVESYKTGTDDLTKAPVGGTQEITGPTILRNPLVLRDSTVAAAFRGYIGNIGPIDASSVTWESSKTANIVVNRTLPRSERVAAARDFLTRFEGNPASAESIVDHYAHKSFEVDTALQENVMAERARKEGYDSIVTYYPATFSKNGAQNVVTEIMDLREEAFPAPDGTAFIRPDMLRSLKQAGYNDLPGVTVEQAAKRDMVMGALGGGIVGNQTDTEQGDYPGLPGQGAFQGMAAGIVSPALARRLKNIPVRKDYPEDFLKAVQGRYDGWVTDEGVEINLQRFQNREVAGTPALRGGVFYTPLNLGEEAYSEYRATNDIPGTVGGSQEITGPTVFRNPFIVSGEQPAYAVLQETLGEAEAQRIVDDIELRFSDRAPRKATIKELRTFLQENGGDGDAALEIASVWGTRHWNTEFAVLENIGAAHARRAGYDALIEYSGTRIGEIHDIREATNPLPDGSTTLRPEILSSLQQSELEQTGKRDVAVGALGGMLGANQADSNETDASDNAFGGALGGALGIGAMRFKTPASLGDFIRGSKTFPIREIAQSLEQLDQGGHDIGLARRALDDAAEALGVGETGAFAEARERLARELGSSAALLDDVVKQADVPVEVPVKPDVPEGPTPHDFDPSDRMDSTETAALNRSARETIKRLKAAGVDTTNLEDVYANYRSVKRSHFDKGEDGADEFYSERGGIWDEFLTVLDDIETELDEGLEPELLDEAPRIVASSVSPPGPVPPKVKASPEVTSPEVAAPAIEAESSAPSTPSPVRERAARTPKAPALGAGIPDEPTTATTAADVSAPRRGPGVPQPEGTVHVVGFGYVAEDSLDDVPGAVEKMEELAASARGQGMTWEQIEEQASRGSLPDVLRKVEKQKKGQLAADIQNLREGWRQGINRVAELSRRIGSKEDDLRVADTLSAGQQLDIWDTLTSVAAAEDLMVRLARGTVKAGSEAARALASLKHTGYAQRGMKYIFTLNDFAKKTKEGKAAALKTVEDMVAGRQATPDRLKALEDLVASMTAMMDTWKLMGSNSGALDAIDGYAEAVKGTSVAKRARKLEKVSDDKLAEKAAEALKKVDADPANADAKLQLDAAVAETARRRRSTMQGNSETTPPEMTAPDRPGDATPPSSGRRADASEGERAGGVTPSRSGPRPVTPSEAEAAAEARNQKYPLELRVQEAMDKERARIQRLQDRLDARLGKQADRFMDMVNKRAEIDEGRGLQQQVAGALKGTEDVWRQTGSGLINDLKQSLAISQKVEAQREKLQALVKQGKMTQAAMDDALQSWMVDQKFPSLDSPEEIERHFGRLMVGLHDQGALGRKMVVELQDKLDAMLEAEGDAFTAKKLAEARKRLVLNQKWTERNEVQAYITRIQELVKQISGPAGRNPEDIRMIADEVKSLFDDVEAMGEYAEGRAKKLRHSIISSGLQRFIGTSQDSDVIEAAMASMRALDPDDPDYLKSVMGLVSSMRNPRWVDYVKEYGITNMLSHPATWSLGGVNVANNFLNIVARNLIQMPGMAAVESATAGAHQAAYGVRRVLKVPGAPRIAKPDYQRTVYWKEIPAAYKATFTAMNAGIQMGLEVLSQGYLDTDLIESAMFAKYGVVPREFLTESKKASDIIAAGIGGTLASGTGETPEDRLRNGMLGAVGLAGYSRLMNKVPEPLQKFGNFGLLMHMISTRPLAAADVLTGHMLYAGQYAAMAERKAAKSGGKLTAEEIMRNPLDHEDVRIQAGKIRDYTLLKQQDFNKKAFSWLAAMPRDSQGRQFAELAIFQLAPFLTVTSNFIGQGLELSAPGVLYDLGRAYKTKDKGLEAGRADAIVKAAVGTTLTLYAAHMYNQGMLSGSGQFDDEGRNTWPEGKEPNSIYLPIAGGRWVSLNGTPFAIPFAVVANAMEYIEGQQRTARERGKPPPSLPDLLLLTLGAGAAGAGTAVLGHPFLQGVYQLGSAVQGRMTTDRFFHGQGSRYVTGSGALRYLAAMGDEYQREAKAEGWDEALGQRVMATLPGYRQEVPAKRGPLGQPMEEPNYWKRDPSTILMPYPRRQPEKDPLVLKLMRKYEVAPPDAPVTEEGVRLKPLESLAIQELTGRYLQQDEAKILADLNALPTARERQDKLRSWVSYARRRAGLVVRTNIVDFNPRWNEQQQRMR